MLRMLMFGKPGAGKGTLSHRLVNDFDLSFVSCGDVLRRHIDEKTSVGREVEKVMANGDLVPDEVMNRVVADELEKLKNNHWIMDGYPRNVSQGQMLDAHLNLSGMPLSLVVILDVDDKVILKRIANRWVHKSSGRVYNLLYNKPQVKGKDDITGELLTQRPDDKPEVFARRLSTYYRSTLPLIEYFKSNRNGRFDVVTLAGRTSDEIWPQLVSTIQNLAPLKTKK